jgi:hypothetical protein
MPPPVWSTIYLLLQKVISPRFIILNGVRPRRAVLNEPAEGGRTTFPLMNAEGVVAEPTKAQVRPHWGRACH